MDHSLLVGTQLRIAVRVLFCAVLGANGCAISGVKWREPVYQRAAGHALFKPSAIKGEAETLYAIAQEHEADCLDSCVDLYFEVAALTQCAACGSSFTCGRCKLHRSALNKLVSTGQQFQRLDPSRGLQIYVDGQPEHIPISHRGFVWEPDDFDQLVPVGNYQTHLLQRKYRRSGAGIPLVVKRDKQVGRPYLTDVSYFPATLVIQSEPSSGGDGRFDDSPASNWSLQLLDPFRVDSVKLDGHNAPIAKDTTAALVYRLSLDQPNPLDSFLAPYSDKGEQRLAMLEPYQPGKIPVVLVHGLLSDPYTWADTVNDLSTCPWFVRHYQIWLYQYPTGEAFLVSAAGLRQKLRGIRQTLDPNYHDPQFARMVLVGHSMGGLVSKLQVTYSGDTLWRAAANRPLDQVNTTEEVRSRVADAFFFQPSPDVARVVYIGTPHEGSSFARRSIGRIGSALVSLPQERAQEHDELIKSNPGVFSREITKRVPTSIDLLEPDSPLLQAMTKLPMRKGVVAHSIIGNKYWTPWGGRSDSVVPVESARDQRAVTEKYVAQKHGRLHRDLESANELLVILGEHLRRTQTDQPTLPPHAEEAQAPLPEPEEVLWLPR